MHNHLEQNTNINPGFDMKLVKQLASKGIDPNQIPDFLRDIVKIITSNAHLGLKGINHNIQKSQWKGVFLERPLFQLILESFEKMSVIDESFEEIINDDQGMSQLIQKIYQERGLDFRGYCKSSLARRLSRFLLSQGITTYDECLKLIHNDSQLIDRLLDAITINVTEFFRDKTAFNTLASLIKQLSMQKKDVPLKIWSAGCATGQEPYTLAMIVLNELDEQSIQNTSIIATDIDPKVLEFSQVGTYDQQSIKELEPEWVNRFFYNNNNMFTIKDSVKKIITFEKHSLVTDAPYEGIDIITCRNVMIYFNIGLQNRVFLKFYRALNSKGYLMLGRYEMLLNDARRFFSSIKFDDRLYQKKN